MLFFVCIGWIIRPNLRHGQTCPELLSIQFIDSITQYRSPSKHVSTRFPLFFFLLSVKVGFLIKPSFISGGINRENKLAGHLICSRFCLTFDCLGSLLFCLRWLKSFLICWIHWRAMRSLRYDLFLLCMLRVLLCCSSFLALHDEFTWIIYLFQEKSGLTVSSLYYGSAMLYIGQEERLKLRYVQ